MTKAEGQTRDGTCFKSAHRRVSVSDGQRPGRSLRRRRCASENRSPPPLPPRRLRSAASSRIDAANAAGRACNSTLTITRWPAAARRPVPRLFAVSLSLDDRKGGKIEVEERRRRRRVETE